MKTISLDTNCLVSMCNKVNPDIYNAIFEKFNVVTVDSFMKDKNTDDLIRTTPSRGGLLLGYKPTGL